MDIKIKRRFNEKDMPDMKSMINEANKFISDISIGETAFMRRHGVKSEGEYKKKIAGTKHIMKHTHIGWNSWSTTEKGFRKIFDELEASGTYVDRFGVCLDWVMGVPEKYRNDFQAGSGLIFKNADEWMAVGQVVPVQPHLGDHMIGSLNSVDNAINGLSAGVTTIGNLSHYYTYEYPGLDLELYRTEDTIKAIAIMAAFREDGAIIHSNLDDGFGSRFHDLVNLVGWASLERYIAEDLLGAGVSHCFGNLFSDPMLRIIFNNAMGKINKFNTPGSMIYGNTIDFGMDIPKNFGALASFSMADIIGQMKYPSGHAVCPIPVTEAIRVPSAEEIIEAHRTVDMMIEKAPYYEKYIDWPHVEAESEILVTCGHIFFERVINGLDGLGIDIAHAGEIMSVLKAIGVEQLESNFGIGKKEKHSIHGRKPIRPTSIISTITKVQNEIVKEQISSIEKKLLSGINIIVGSTDVHEFGKEIVKNITLMAGANVYDLGTTVSIDEISDTVIETESKVVLISTYNGIAYSFGKDLLEKLKKENLNVKVIMGGRLNEPIPGSDLPVDVSEKLQELGICVDNDAEKLISIILEQSKV